MAGSMGVTAKLLLGAANGTPGTAMDFVSENLKRQRPLVDTNALAGTRTRWANRAVPGIRPVGGPLSCQPTAIEWETLLPWILGGTPSGTSYPQAENLLMQAYWVLRGLSPTGAGKIFKYPVVGVGSARISSSQGAPLAADLDLLGAVGSGLSSEDSTTAGSSFPSFTLDKTTNPWMHHELVLTINSTIYQCKDFTITLDNAVDAGRYFNTQDLQTIQATDRRIAVSASLPYGDAAAAYALSQGGVPVTAVYTNGVYVLTFSMPLVQFEDPTPTASSREEIMLALSGSARGTTAAGDELAVTLATS
jgi:hypothetical protein